MTICVAVKVGEGLVLAADSASTLLNVSGGIVQIFEHARKLSQIKDYPIGALTWGQGSIGARNIESLVLEFANPLTPLGGARPLDVQTVANQLFQFMQQRYQAAYGGLPPNQPPPPLGMLVGGISTGNFFPEVYVWEFPRSTAPTLVMPDQPNGSPTFGAVFYGQTDALVRLLRGYDPRLPQLLTGAGVQQALITQIETQFLYGIPFDSMPLQDAVDFADYLCKVVIGRFRFVVGPPTCGGEVDIAAITPRGFQWIRQKSLSAP
jgi:hypothetical protein